MMRFATLLAVFATVEAEKYKCNNKQKIECNAPKSAADLDACECICPATTCESYQSLGDDCVCADNPCENTCAVEGVSVEDDFDKGPQPDCKCMAADGEDPCDAKYGGAFTEGLDGAACPVAEEETTEGGEEGMGESGASQLLAGAMVLAASLLI